MGFLWCQQYTNLDALWPAFGFDCWDKHQNEKNENGRFTFWQAGLSDLSWGSVCPQLTLKP